MVLNDITRFRKVGNYFLNLSVNVLFGTKFTDLCYGYNAFWRTAVKVMDLPDVDLPPLPCGDRLWGDGFEIEKNDPSSNQKRTSVCGA